MQDKRTSVFIGVWTIAFLIALSLDTRVARFNHDSGFAHFVAKKNWAETIKFPGTIWFNPPIVLLLWRLRRIRGRQALFVLAAGALSGANALAKWIVGRTRPYKFPTGDPLQPFTLRPCLNGVWGLFHQHDLSFPSGHECTAGALAVAIWFVWPRGRWIFTGIALLVGIERIAENAHYTSDVVAAAGFALLCTSSLHAVMGRWIAPVELRSLEVETI
jgi:membrane-associated phospholipid phosphatase